MRIGYSFWGFLGPGITDTPDGGRSHRATLTDGLAATGHELVFLQPNRDLDEAQYDLTGRYQWDQGLPAIDALFLEWRWPVSGRNTTACGSPGHTCDLHRQDELLMHYTLGNGTQTVLWDKDRMLPGMSSLRSLPQVTVCEPALRPSPGAVSLLFPVPDDALDNADPAALAMLPRPLPLVYVGNQYGRDAAFDRFLAPAAAVHPHRVAGKWTRTSSWPHVNFTGRIAFGDMPPLYKSALTTVLLLPDRYALAGQMTQRIFEAVLAGCLPLTPAALPFARQFTPEALHVADGHQAASRLTGLKAIAGTSAHAALIGECTGRLSIFRLSRQLAVIDTILRRPAHAT